MPVDRPFSVAALWRSVLCALAGAMAVVYVAWNVFHLAQGRVPPSLFLAITGLPAPTTGGTRAICQLYLGNWSESLRYNAMAVPICLVMALSLAWLARQWRRHERLALPRAILWSWVAVLGIAWVMKLAGDPGYW